MRQTTAVIDIGSNSVRLVVYEQSSRYGYRLICEQKSRVRIGEGAYTNNGNIQPLAITRALNTLKSFIYIINQYDCNKTITIATSALRDAPNKAKFLTLVKNEIGIDIDIISGKKEAQYGGLAVCNLLHEKNCISIDIGGGSSDLALIRDGIVAEAISLDIGTVRIKELFFDKNKSTKEAKEYTRKIVQTIPKEFKSNIAIGIGGTARTIASCIIDKTSYPLDKLHAFTFKLESEFGYLQSISNSSLNNIKQYPIKQSRHDTIREGVIIFLEILKQLNSEVVVTSSAGVRDGVFLENILKKNNYKFPENINPNLESILDRFYPKNKEWFSDGLVIANMITNLLEDKFDQKYLKELSTAVSLSKSGQFLDIYNTPYNSSYVALHELNYSFTHQQIVFIALLLSSSKGKIKKKEFLKYKTLLPSKDTIKWYVFIYSLTILIRRYTNSDKLELTLELDTILIQSKDYLYILEEEINAIRIPKGVNIKICYP